MLNNLKDLYTPTKEGFTSALKPVLGNWSKGEHIRTESERKGNTTLHSLIQQFQFR